MDGPGQTSRPAVPRVPLPPSHMLHKYRIERLIGEGGFALTYQAVEPVLGRTVAIKELYMPQVTARRGTEELDLIRGSDDVATYEWVKFFFSREAQITFGLRHEGVVRMYEFFRKNNTAYIVYEFLQGETLVDWLTRTGHKLNQADFMRFVDRTSRTLAYVHGSGILHRDIKPENIMVESTGTNPVLIDFGAALQKGQEDKAGIPIVTTGFSPPEQYVPGSRQDERTDLYAYCATLYWMLSGQRPPAAQERQRTDALPHLSSTLKVDFAHSRRLSDAVMRGMSLDPAQRQPTVGAFLDDVFPRVTLVTTGYTASPRGEKVFVSYRREDSSHFSGRLLDFIEMRFGTDSVFFDIESIPVGVDFWDHIKSILSECAAMLVVIGPRWGEVMQARRRRWYHLRRNDDYVALEIAAASELKLPIIPVLFDRATMPAPRDLPKALHFLPQLNASLISDGKAFRTGADGICDQIARLRKTFREQSGAPDHRATSAQSSATMPATA